MPLTDDSLWYKDAIIYQLHVKAFLDSTGDGIGDFAGLTRKLDYLADLGVTAVWILPFYPSPLRDDGYDIADYRNVNPSYGSMRDFHQFVREAHKRNLRVITELVINHTSDQHPWFQRARRAKPGSAARNFYVWSDSDQKYAGTRIIFTDTEPSNWAWDPEAQAYYWHRFFSHQPDLNFDNPRVFEEVTRVMKHWLAMGVDGLRLDAIPYLVERDGTNNENLPETHGVIRRLRGWLENHFPGRMLLGEANQWPEDVLPYFGDADECHMAFHFPLMPRMYMALAQEDRHPITDILRQTPDIPETCQWAVFLRNHDELTLEMVTDRERDYLWQYYAADHRARINLGIRRRLAPLLDNDRRKIELLKSLLLSMPGTPVLYYGDEIGMGDNIFLGDRDGVRTPMQWSPDRNGGFSSADPQSLYLPPVMDPIYGFQSVNVEAQARNPASLLNWVRRLLAVRKAHRAFSRGTLTLLYPGNRKVLAYLREDDGETILCVANLSRSAQPVELDLSAYNGRVPVELVGNSAFPPIGELPYFITLPAYGFYWFLLAEEAEAPKWHTPFTTPMPDLETLVFNGGWQSLTAGRSGEALTERILPEFLPNQRWFAAKESRLRAIREAEHAVLDEAGVSWLVSCWDIEGEDGTRQRYQLPLAVTWEGAADEAFSGDLQSFALARLRKFNRVGLLHDALADEPFSAALARAIEARREIPASRGGHLACLPTTALAARPLPDELSVRRLGREQSNTSMLIGADMVLKVYRRLEPGLHPEIEIGRFLTDVAGFTNAPPLLGSVELVDAGGTPTAMAVLQGFVVNQGDGWEVTQEYLSRFFESRDLIPEGEAPSAGANGMAVYMTLATILGRRVAGMHRAFALDTDDPAFKPEPVTAADVAAWTKGAHHQAAKAKQALKRARRRLAGDVAEAVAYVLDHWDRVEARIEGGLPIDRALCKTRLHGDFHLGQVVLAKDDFYILDFEGEPIRSMAERRAKGMPMRDVAGMLRSFNYAVWSALLRRSDVRPEALADERPWAEEWEAAAVSAFMAGYREELGPCRSVPGSEKTFKAHLDFFILEKALYEICYEAANRPNWLRIPIQGVRRLIG